MKNFLIKLALFVFIVFSGLNSADAVLQGWVPPEDYGAVSYTHLTLPTNREV